jgi:hypothetical protein
VNAQDLLTNQVTYLTYLLSQKPDRVEAENLRPTYVILQQVKENELPEPAVRYIRQIRPLLEEYLRQRRPVGLKTVEWVLLTLRRSLAASKEPPMSAAWQDLSEGFWTDWSALSL